MSLKRYDWIEPRFAREAWGRRHIDALYVPQGAPNSSEQAIVEGLRAWINYAHNHQARFEQGIGTDGVLGPAWAQWGAALRTLLNGDLGRLDGGTLDHIIAYNLTEQGFNPDEL